MQKFADELATLHQMPHIQSNHCQVLSKDLVDARPLDEYGICRSRQLNSEVLETLLPFFLPIFSPDPDQQIHDTHHDNGLGEVLK